MLKPFLYAIAGVVAAVKGERNMRIHLVAAVGCIVFMPKLLRFFTAHAA